MEMDLLGYVLREERRESDVGLEVERERELGVRERKWREQVEETIDAAAAGEGFGEDKVLGGCIVEEERIRFWSRV